MIVHFQTQADKCDEAVPGLNAAYKEASEKVEELDKSSAAYEETWSKNNDDETVIAN